MSSFNGELVELDIDLIIANPYQPRKIFDEEAIVELSESIKAYGILQPVSVRKLNNEKYELVAGERRLRAAKMINLKKIPSIVLEMKDQESAALALIENLQREDLNFFEEAMAYEKLIKEHSFTQNALAKKVGKGQSTVANKLRILKLSNEVKKMLLDNNLTERHARALLKLEDEDMQLMVVEKVVKNELTVSKTEKLIKSMLEELKSGDNKESKQKVKSFIDYKIYINTVKNAYEAIKQTGMEARYEEKDKGDYIELVVKLPKKK